MAPIAGPLILNHHRESPVPENWVAPSPIANIDRYLIALRGAIILFVGIPSLFGGFRHDTLVAPWIVLIALIVYNLPVSIYIWFKQPLAHHHFTRVIIGDVLQAALAVVVTGGYTSFYFVLFFLVIAEIALTVRWQPALGLILGIVGLQIIVTIVTPTATWEPFAAYIADAVQR